MRIFEKTQVDGIIETQTEPIDGGAILLAGELREHTVVLARNTNRPWRESQQRLRAKLPQTPSQTIQSAMLGKGLSSRV